MIKGKMKGKFIEILQSLKDCGYNVKCKLMNAMWYDVPQSRERLIFIGIRNDLGIEPTFPKPNNYFIKCGEICDNESGEDISKYAIYNELVRLKEGQKSEKYLNLIKADKTKPLNAITKTAGICGAASVAKWNNKKFPINELQLCQSFPLSFRFIGNYTNAVERIGNSVPPNLMKAIALNILTIFENVPRETVY